MATLTPPRPLRARPKRVIRWTLEQLLDHLDYAVNLELWTIPYYMTVMYSIKDPSHPVFQLIRAVVDQEMLHAQLAANVYNAFQPKHGPNLGPFHYTKEGGVPHLDFKLDPAAVKKFGEPDASLGGLDLTRIGTMCLIELPESHPPAFDPDEEEYATIGDFYEAVRFGMRQRSRDLRGNLNQVDYFKNFYGNLSETTVTSGGGEGLVQALKLIDVITAQGEGRTKGDLEVPIAFQNTADGYDESDSHFLKFESIRDGLLLGRAPETYSADPKKKDTEPQRVLVENFAKLVSMMQALFSGVKEPEFGALMPTVGASILNCWRKGVVPQFSAKA